MSAKMWAAVCALATAQFSFGAGASSVTIASSTNDVRLQAASEAARPAKPDEVVADGVAVQTGENSRVELKIGENVVRLGANTAIRPEKGGRIINLSDGLILIDATRHSRARRIEFGQVAAEIGSSTVIAESHPGVYKLLVLHGTSRVYRPGHFGDSILVRAGQLIIGNPKDAMSDPVDFDVARFAGTCRLITEFSPLPSASRIAREGERQQRAKTKKHLIDTNLVIFGKGTSVSLVNDGTTPPVDQGETGGPTPPPPLRGKVTTSPAAMDTAVKASR